MTVLGCVGALLTSACGNKESREAPDQAWKADWSFVMNDAQGNSIYIDKASLRKEGANVTYWTLSTPGQSPQSPKRTVTHIEENCIARRWRIVKMIIHGATMGAIYSDGTDWVDLPSDSPQRQATHNIGCS